MKIIHYLKHENNFSYFLNCPLCGNDFVNRHKVRALEDAKNRVKLIENKNQDVDNELETEKIFEMKCSKCIFEIEYHLPVAVMKNANIINEKELVYLN